jgi:hypothetical protein
MFRKCFCGHCPECKLRKVSQYYAVQSVNLDPESHREPRIYDVKPDDGPDTRGPQSTWALVMEALIGRGEARRGRKHPRCA